MPPAFSFAWRAFFCREGSLLFCCELGFCFRREAFLLYPGFSIYQEASLLASMLFLFPGGFSFCREKFLFARGIFFFFFFSGDYSFKKSTTADIQIT